MSSKMKVVSKIKKESQYNKATTNKVFKNKNRKNKRSEMIK